MEVSLILVLFAGVGIYLIFWFDSLSSAPIKFSWPSMPHREHADVPPRANQFHAVSLLPAKECCSAVESFSSTRFLTADAPTLPVAGCSQVQCNCVFVHHQDRRLEGPDRRQSQDRRSAERGEASDRRQFSGRRRSDWSPLVQV